MPQRPAPLTIELALLGYVRGEPLHGYEIYQQLVASGGLGDVWSVKQPLLYAHLKRLEAECLLTGTVEVQSDRPARRLLAITPAGEAAFAQWLVQPVTRGRDLRLEFLAKLYFARREADAVALRLLGAQDLQLCQWLDRLAVRRHDLPAGAIYERLVIDYRCGQVTAALTWLAAVRTEFMQIEPAEA